MFFSRAFTAKTTASMLALSFLFACSSTKNASNNGEEILLGDEVLDGEASGDIGDVGAEGLPTDELNNDNLETGSVSIDGEEDFSAEGVSASDTSVAEAQGEVITPDDTSSTTAVSAAIPSETEETTEAPAPQAYRGARQVKVERSPFEKAGFIMNSFYLVQNAQEDYASLSVKIYGRPDRATLLKKWNTLNTLKVGSVVYYNSPFRHNDNNQMLSFAEDFGFANEKIAVRRGDSLSSIAQKLYGDAQAWRVIAALNPELSNPDLIEVGQQLAYQPQIDTEAKLQDFVKATAEPQPSAPSAAPAIEAPRATEQVAEAPAEVAPEATKAEDIASSATDEEMNLEDEIAEGSADTSSEKSNKKKDDLFFYAGAGLIVLALVYILLRRRQAKI
jgi:hypothetical protein